MTGVVAFFAAPLTDAETNDSEATTSETAIAALTFRARRDGSRVAPFLSGKTLIGPPIRIDDNAWCTPREPPRDATTVSPLCPYSGSSLRLHLRPQDPRPPRPESALSDPSRALDL